VQTYLTQRIASHFSEKIGANIQIGKVDIAFFRKIILKDVLIEDQQADTLLYVQSITARIDTLKIRKKKLAFKNIEFIDSRLHVQKDTSNLYNFAFIIDALTTAPKVDNDWMYNCRQFDFNNSVLLYSDIHHDKERLLAARDFHLNISDFFLASDSVFFKLNKMAFHDGKGFIIHDMQSEVILAQGKIGLSGFYLKSGNSDISGNQFLIELPGDESRFPEDVQFDFMFSPSRISFYDLAMLVPALKGMDQVVELSGQVHGNINNLKGKNLRLATGNKTEALLDFYVNDVTSIETMYLFLDLKDSKTTFDELSRIKLPGNGKVRYLHFPETLHKAGEMTYRGNFTGFLTDFVAYGTLTSRMGRITTDLSVVPDGGKRVTYRGKVATRDFLLGRLLKNEHVGNISANGSVDGYYEPANHYIAGKFQGGISRIDINNYQYTNIRLDGILNNRMFDGMVLMNDSNLRFDFLGKINFNPEVPVFDFRLDLQKALPGKLNLGEKYPEAEMAFLMNANFSGSRIDNLVGSIKVEDGQYTNRNGELDLGGIELQSISSGLNNYLTFSSDYFDIEVNGRYHFQNILDAFEKSMHRYLPIVNYDPRTQAKENKFGYQIDVKNLNDITAVFAPAIKIETPFLLYGQMDSERSVFELKGSIPGIRTDNILIRNIFIGNNPRDNVFASRFRFGEVLLKNGMKIENLTIDSEIENNIIVNQIAWGKEGNKNYSGEILSRAVLSKNKNSPYSHVEIEGYPSQIFIADTLWQIHPFSATIDSTTINIGNFQDSEPSSVTMG
jgi:hypothetical protein